MSFIEELNRQLANVDLGDLAEPREDGISENDHVVGSLPDDLKRLYTLRLRSITDEPLVQAKALRALADVTQEHRGVVPAASVDDVERSLELQRHRRRALDTLFWTALRTEFPELATKRCLAIRKGWQVVWSEDESDDAPRALIIIRGR
ncbi:MAG: hypothetical protein Q7S23_04285 [bacterium]|nr:hypothetical protein [bacterium]